MATEHATTSHSHQVEVGWGSARQGRVGQMTMQYTLTHFAVLLT
jgi:hypothetical protein